MLVGVERSGFGRADGQSPGLYVTSRASGTPESFAPATLSRVASPCTLAISAVHSCPKAVSPIILAASRAWLLDPACSLHDAELKISQSLLTLEGEGIPALLQDLWPGNNRP